MSRPKRTMSCVTLAAIFCIGLIAWTFTPPAEDELLAAGETPIRSKLSSAWRKAKRALTPRRLRKPERIAEPEAAIPIPVATRDNEKPPAPKKRSRNISKILLASFKEEQKPSPDPFPVPPELRNIDLMRQTDEQADAKSWGCLECHKGSHDPHYKDSIRIGCTDCHGGDASTTEYRVAHVFPKFESAWKSAANPIRSYTLLNHERPEFIQFVNPGDLRVAHLSCGTTNCHSRETLEVKKSMMTHGCMLWGAALYANGSVPSKVPMYGESYSMHGNPQRLQTVPPPTQWEIDYKGVVPFLDPLPRFQAAHPGSAYLLRFFERGGRFATELGIPERTEEPGRPRLRQSNRGMGTLARTDPVVIGLAKTRLLDPTLNFLGTNDHPGDYRSSGCTACHMIYANDRSPVHSGPYAKYGNRGLAAGEVDDFVKNVDPMIAKDESGHPIAHRFTTAIPTSQCIICHMHPGTTVLQSYIGYMWHDQETDGELLYPAIQNHPSSEQFVRSQMSDSVDGAAKSKMIDPEFLANLTDLNTKTKHRQFSDFHGHGWSYTAVFKKDREGRLLDHQGKVVENMSNEKARLGVLIPQYVAALYRNRDKRDPADIKRKEAELEKLRQNVPVHMLDIHMEKGMHCIDCHFIQDVHGDTKLYGEVRAAIEIQCIDCHGTVAKPANLRTTGPAAKGRKAPAPSGRLLSTMRTPFGKRRFEVRPDGKIIQNSMVEASLSWEVSQVVDLINPDHEDYNANAALAKTVRFNSRGQMEWGDVPDNDPDRCGHANKNMSCIACHSSWNPSCFGCHLVQKADKKMPELHYEGDATKNYTAYDWGLVTLRDDVYMLSKDGNVTWNRIGPARSACAVQVSSYNNNREAVYSQQQTISSGGYSGFSYSSNVPHTVRGNGETKMCADCHISHKEDNNAIMAQLLMQGTNYMNMIGRYCWIASGEHGIWAPIVTEREEPQAVIGSNMHKLAFPKWYKEHVANGRKLKYGHEHPGHDISTHLTHPRMKSEILNLQVRGEYLYAACGEAGFRVFDVAMYDNKAFAERITTAPVSPFFGQRFFIRTKYCTDIASPSTVAPDPTRPADGKKYFEQPVSMFYAFIYVVDKYEGLIPVLAATLLDSNPNNNFLERAYTFNPDGILDGAVRITLVGTNAYICCDAGIVVINLSDPFKPKVVHTIGTDIVKHPHAFQAQFRYGYCCDEEGIKVFDMTDLDHPKPVSKLELPHAHNIYLARTYGYVSCGEHGMVILNIKDPRMPVVDQVFDADGVMNDVHDIQLSAYQASEIAFVADGKNGLRVIQLTSPHTPGNDGFSPRPTPELIATFEIPHHGHAYAISKGIDRDRAVDESGNQIGNFDRIGARPLNLKEQQKLYLRNNKVWRVKNFARDYSIDNLKQREARLQSDIKTYYPSYRRPTRQAKRQAKRVPMRPFTTRRR